MNKELRNKIIKYNNLKVKYNRVQSENIIFKMRYLLDDIILSMIKENKGYENLYNKSGNTKTLKKLKLYELNDYIKDKRKYKIRNYLINRGNRDFNGSNNIKIISDKMCLGLVREK